LPFVVELKDIVDLILKVRVGGYLLEMANPRHEHEWRVWERVKLPKGRMLIPGVISHATNGRSRVRLLISALLLRQSGEEVTRRPVRLMFPLVRAESKG
jgi:methionine synthase II (cobalamin-independent)